MGRGSRKNKNLAPANKNGSPANNGTIYASRRHLYRAFPNSGRGQCGLLALIQEVMEAEGVSPSEILRRTNGELGAELEARVRRLRKSIVAAAHERKGIELDEDPAADGGRTVKECLKDGDIKSYKMFCDVMGREDGWLDPLAMVLGANAIGLEGMQLVETKKEDKAKKTEGGKANEPERLYYASSTTPVEECPCMILIHDGHFEALYQVPDDLREEEERLASEAAARSAETLRQAEEKRLASEAAAARSAEILRRAEEERLASEAAARSAAFAHAVAVPSMRAAPSASPAPTAVPVETAAQAPSPAPTAVPVETAAPSASPAHTAVPVVTAAPAASPAPAVPVVTATTDLPVPETWDLSAATPTASAAPTAVPVVAAPADLPAVGTRMVDAVVKGGDETQGESDDSTAFEILAPDPSRICRVVRGRRYRPVRTASQCAKKVRPFDGVKYTVEIKDTHPSTSDATTSIAVAVDVTIPGGSTSSERHSGYLKGAVGATRSPHLCLFGGGLGRRLSPLGSIRGGACPEEEQGATAAEHETASNCSVHAGAQVTEKSYFLMDQSAEEPGQPGDHDNPGDAKERGEPVELGEPVDAGESGQPGGHGNATGPEEQEETVEPAGEVEQPGGHGNDADPEEQGEPDDPKANLDRLFLELVDLAERDQIPGVQDTFFRTVEQLVGEGVLVSEAFRGTAASQRNAFPRAKKKTYVVVTGREQSGKMLETFVALLKGWMQANHAPVLVLMNSRKDLVRFKDGICAFNKYVSRIWKLAGGEDKDAPAFNMFQDGHTNAYKEALVRATKGRSDIPIMVLIDNPNRTGPFRDDIVPAVREVCGTTDGSVNMCLAIDEADLGYRGGLSAGEKIFLGLEGGGGSLYQLASSCILITATPAAIHLSRNRFKDKERRVDEITPSTNYWGFKTGQEKPGQVNFKAIARQIGGLQDMVNTMASASGRRCALAVQSVESNNDNLDKRAMLSAIKNRGVKGFLAVSWTAKYAKLYTSDADAIKAFDDARPKRFSKKKIGAAEVMELVKEEEAMRREKEEEGKAGKHHEKGKKRAREGKKGENTRKRKRGKGKESGENMPDEEQPGGDGGKFEPIYQYTPVSAKNRDYRSIVTFLHNETELEPKILITAKNAAARGESIKGRDHECPLDYMHVAMRKSNYEYMKQAVARVASNDNRPPGFGPILFASAEMHAIHSNGIIAQENLIERLKSGDIELESLRDLEQKVTTAPEGATVFSKVALEDIDARRMTRLAAAQEVARLVDDILSTTRLKDITIVSQPAAEEMGEVVGEQMAGGGGGEEEQRGDHPTATVVPAGGGLAEETGAEGGESGNANEEEEDEKMAGDADISVPEFVKNNRNELVRIFREEVNEKMLDVPSMAEAMLNSDHFKGFERLKARNIVRHIQSHEGGVRGLLREARVVFDPEDSVFVLF